MDADPNLTPTDAEITVAVRAVAIPRFSADDLAEQRRSGRYIDGPVGPTLVCLDCGSVVHVSLVWKHDDFHDGE